MYLIWSFLFTLSAWFAPQSTAPSQQITLDVVANDKSGKPVTGLQQQDFTIFDNKQRQNVVSFEPQSGSQSGEITIVIDTVNTSFSKVGYEREQIKKFLRLDGGRLAHPVSIALFTESGLKLQENPSADGNALASIIDQNETGLRSIRRSTGFYGATERAQLSLRTLSELVADEAKKPGRHIIIWVSPGWPLLSGPNVQLSAKDERGIFNSIVSISNQLKDTRTTLYSVNPLGTNEGLGRENYYEQFLNGVRKETQAQFGDLGLQVLASQSGGRVLQGSNDLAAELEACFKDKGAYYSISFSPEPGNNPNEYHSIEVKIAQPGIKAQTRSGYYMHPIQ